MSQAAQQDLAPGRAATIVAVAGGAAVFLLASAALFNALVEGRPLPQGLRHGAVLAHPASVMLALPLGAAQLLLPKGTVRHRVVGYVWIALMVFTALASFAVHGLNPGGLSPIHGFSAATLVAAPLIVVFARTGKVGRHRQAALGLIIGGLVIAGLFTFLPGCILGDLAARQSEAR